MRRAEYEIIKSEIERVRDSERKNLTVNLLEDKPHEASINKENITRANKLIKKVNYRIANAR